jgi:hypothetical protein
MKHTRNKFLGVLTVLSILFGCTADVNSITGPSSLGNTLAISAFFGSGGLPTGGGQATIRVEVVNANSTGVDGATVTLTTTLGTLGSAALTTVGGVATTTLTSGTDTGNAYIVATVDNVTATAVVPIVVI